MFNNNSFNIISKNIIYLIKTKEIKMRTIEGKWGFFRPEFRLALMLYRGTYFDNRYAISFAFIGGYFYIKLPFRTNLKNGSDMPRYGMDNHNGILWLYCGGKYDNSLGQMRKERMISFYYPFINYEFEYTEVLNNADSWERFTSEEYYEDILKWAKVVKLPYKYKLKSGVIQNVIATCYQERRHWHRKWFPFLKKTTTSIEVKFSDEVGEGIGSWKGGTISCSYRMKFGEDMEKTLRRMERERKF